MSIAKIFLRLIRRLTGRLTRRQKSIGWIILAGAILFLITLPPRPAAPLPAPEAAFIAAVDHARIAWIDAPNDLAKIGMRQARGAALCSALPSLIATGWTGWISQIEPDRLPDLAGKTTATIVLALTRHITLSTPANPLFNPADAMVEAGSPIYATASRLPLGQKVIFSARFQPSPGDCMTEESFTADGSMRNPDFKIVLTALAGS
jgi:hypothetical protein